MYNISDIANLYYYVRSYYEKLHWLSSLHLAMSRIFLKYGTYKNEFYKVQFKIIVL